MWFFKSKHEKGGSDRRDGSSKINTRRDQRLNNQPRPLPKVVWIPLAGLASLALLGVLVWKIGALLFWENPAYAIRSLAITVDGPTITAAHVKEYMKVAEGTNLFSSSLASLRADFLKRTPIAKSVTLHRKLPSTLAIEIVERTPLARLGRWGSLAVDREGFVFSLRTGTRDYPVISGCAIENLKPGVRVDQAVLNAIEVVDVCNRNKVGEQVKIASLDVSPKEYFELYLAAGERVKIGWPDMDQPVSDIRERVERKLTALAGALRASEERGRRLVNLDLTFTDQYIPGQEY